MFDSTEFKKTEEPLSFQKCIDYMECSAKLNATVRSIIDYRPEVNLPANFSGELENLVQNQLNVVSDKNPKIIIEKELNDILDNRKYIPLTKNVRQSSIAIAVYAGDGLVAKVTNTTYLTPFRPLSGMATTLPRVLAPIITRKVDDYYIEIFPWIDQSKVSYDDVSVLSNELLDMGLAFCNGDARVDNVGRLPDGTLTVLDGNAVQIVEFQNEDSKREFEDTVNLRQMRWYRKLDKNFPELYAALSKDNLQNHLSYFFNNPIDYEFRFPKKVN